MVVKPYRTHACMLKWQGQVSMLLGKLSTLVDHKTFLTIANTTVKALHQITLPPAITTKLAPPAPPRCIPCNKQILQKISPDLIKFKGWAEDSATLYLAETLSYTLKKALLGLQQYERYDKDLSCEIDNTPMLQQHLQLHGRLQEEASQAVKWHHCQLLQNSLPDSPAALHHPSHQSVLKSYIGMTSSFHLFIHS